MHAKLKDLQQVVGTFVNTVQTVVCNESAKNCMYRECEHCKNKVVHFTSDEQDEEMTWWWQWQIVTEIFNTKTVQDVEIEGARERQEVER